MRHYLRRALSAIQRGWHHPATGITLGVVTVAAVLLWLLGCAFPQDRTSTIEQEQRETVTGSATTDIANRTISAPSPTTIEVPGADGATRIEIPPTTHADIEAYATASESSDSAASGRASWSVSTPFLIAAGFGLLALAVAGWLLFMLLRKSAAVRSAWKVGDEFMSSGIDVVKTMAMSETDPKAAGVLSSVVSALEGKRANFNQD